VCDKDLLLKPAHILGCVLVFIKMCQKAFELFVKTALACKMDHKMYIGEIEIGPVCI
jgi:hypothetical protein